MDKYKNYINILIYKYIFIFSIKSMIEKFNLIIYINRMNQIILKYI